jgi:hypothetical protein
LILLLILVAQRFTAAIHRRDNRLVLSAGFRGCGKTMVSYQGIALAIP